MPKSECGFPGVGSQHFTIRPIGVYALSGLTVDRDQFLLCGHSAGLFSVDRSTHQQYNYSQPLLHGTIGSMSQG